MLRMKITTFTVVLIIILHRGLIKRCGWKLSSLIMQNEVVEDIVTGTIIWRT